jgi:hypothetical protein
VAAQQQRMTELPVRYVRALGVPVVFVHQVSRQRRRKARASAERTNDPAGMTV